MKKFAKVLGMLAAFVLVICMTVGITVAALTANTGTITNTFVATTDLLQRANEFTLREHVATLGDGGNSYVLTEEYKKDADLYVGNQYTGLLQGMVMAKDPKVAITATNVTAESYLFVVVKAVNVGGLEYQLNVDHTDDESEPVTGAFNDITTAVNAIEAVPAGYTVLAFKTTVAINAPVAETSILYGDKVTVTDVSGITGSSSLAFTAYLCQTAGFASPEAAFAANWTLV